MKMNVGKKVKIIFPILFLCIVALLTVCFWRNSQKQTAPQPNASESTVQSADTTGSGSSEPAEKPDIPIDFQTLQTTSVKKNTLFLFIKMILTKIQDCRRY